MCSPAVSNHRSFLFVPGDRPERFEKAFASEADAVILDLEDSVAFERKSEARANVGALLQNSVFLNRTIVRINPFGSKFAIADLEACRSKGVAAIMLPKSDEDAIAWLSSNSEEPIISLVETVQGVRDLNGILSHPNVQQVAFGTVDFAGEVGLDEGTVGGDFVLNSVRAQLVMQSRLFGKAAPIDGVTTDLQDMSVLQDACEFARGAGMSGKMCIHPVQCKTVNLTFEPTLDEVTWATEVLERSSVEAGAFRFQGSMVDRPVLDRARAILSRDRSKNAVSSMETQSIHKIQE